MTWHLTEDVEQFLAAAGDLLLAEPALHTISLTVCENARARPDGTVFAWWQEPSHEVAGAVSTTPPYPMVLGAVPDHAIRPLVDVLSPNAVNGPTGLAVQVAALAAQTLGGTASVVHAERLFRLGTLTPPYVPGTARTATDDDVPLLVAWMNAFVAEAGVVADDIEAGVRDRLSHQGYLVWEVGGPVALGGHTRVAFGSGRIGPIFTPPEHRRKGYGAAVTAASSQQLLDRGAREVVLFTDLTNPTSNALYPRLGYEPLSDRAILHIT